MMARKVRLLFGGGSTTATGTEQVLQLFLFFVLFLFVNLGFGRFRSLCPFFSGPIFLIINGEGPASGGSMGGILQLPPLYNLP